MSRSDRFYLTGEVMDSAVPVLAGAPFFKLCLHTVENGGIDDRLVVALDMVLRNLAVILFRNKSRADKL